MAVLKSGDTTLEIRYNKISTLTEDAPQKSSSPTPPGTLDYQPRQGNYPCSQSQLR